jgi:glutamyl-tRNA synthetase
LLHLGHAKTFLVAYDRAGAANGTLVLRNEDLDPQRSKPEFVRAFIEDLHWLGIEWQEGPDIGGPYAPYSQSERRDLYLATWRKLRDAEAIYPCTCSRKELQQSAQAPHDDEDDEPIYPGTCREKPHGKLPESPAGVNWRFRCPAAAEVTFTDLNLGPRAYLHGRDFGDFVIWRRDDVPAYQLAVVADDAAMQITEVVRGADLLKSTARQLLLFEALALAPPQYFHCELVRDEAGHRLAKRTDALSIRALRDRGLTPQDVKNL